MPYPDGGEVYAIRGSSFANTYSRDGALVSEDDDVPSQKLVLDAWGAVLRAGGVYRKTASVHAMEAYDDGEIETIVNGAIETRKAYQVGDVIICGPTGERYTMQPDDFAKRYDIKHPRLASDAALVEEGFQMFQATNRIWALALTAAQVKKSFPSGNFMAAWDSPITVEQNDFLAMHYPDGGEIYRVKAADFEKTYASDR